MFRFFYTCLFVAVLPLIFARLWWKEKKVPGYRIRWLQRLGIFSAEQHGKTPIWIHAVSVGEFIAAIPLIRALQLRQDLHVMVTTMTPTGSDRVMATFGDSVEHVYAPYDLPWTTHAFLKRVKPSVVIIMETELWPNMIYECHRNHVPIILANGRLSERSAKRYARFARISSSFFNMLSHVAAQSIDDAERYKKIGLDENKISVIGSIKFDLQIPDQIRHEAQDLKKAYSLNGTRKVIIAASTHHGEDQQILSVFKKLLLRHKNLLLILVPRHPERFQDVYQLASDTLPTAKRSWHQSPDQHTKVVVGDTMGEMMLLYGASDIAFVGGSLIKRGGHNMIEAAAWGLPIICGPHTFNFSDIAARLEKYQGMKTVQSQTDLFYLLNGWLESPAEVKRVGDNALKCANENRGGIKKLLHTLDKYL